MGALVGADSSARDFVPTARRRSFPGRRVRMGDRRNEPMELRPASDRTASANHHPILCSSGCRFWPGRPVRARFRSPRIAIPCLACFARLLGDLRISYRDYVASQHLGQSRLHTNELSPCDPDRWDHRSLGNQLHCVSVYGRRGNFVERRGKTMATSRARCRSGVRRLRSVCFWQVAIAIKSSRSIGCGHTPRQGRADEHLSWVRRASIELVGEYAAEIPRITPAGTQVVVLPEKIGRISETALAEVDSLYSSAASSTGAAIVLGLVRKTPSGAFNSSRLYSVDGKLEANYDKHHLLPGVEPEKPGDKRVVLDEPSGHWGLQICKDMDFPKLSREYAAEGANLLLVPAWDFNLDGWLHARMAVLRAVENGFALARSARNGLLTLSDNRGRILAETETVPDRFASITGKVNVSREQTFYARTGDWFAWLCVAAFISLLAFQFLAASHAGEKRHA